MKSILLGRSSSNFECLLLSRMANRHGLIAGATGTGKTVTLQALAHAFSRDGVPVFATDIKGDLSGIGSAGVLNDKLQQRWNELQLAEFQGEGCPVSYWDVYGSSGTPLRTTVSELGPLLFSRLLDLNDTQTAVIHLVFKIADDNGYLLLDLQDLSDLLNWVAENAKELQAQYGQLAKPSIGAIQRGVLALQARGGSQFFGEPAFELDDLLTLKDGKGIIHLLDATTLMAEPTLYATVLLWLLSELFETLPEVGDLEQPKLVLFFDEAHLLFTDAPKILLQKIEQLVRLIRSKGVGVFFVTQNPLDIPETVLAQLGNRVQHALRAFTPKDEKAVKTAARTFRQNPSFKTDEVITTLGVGQALISFLDESGTPNPVEIIKIIPPRSKIGPIDETTRKGLVAGSTLDGKYRTLINRESASERLKARATKAAPGAVDTIQEVGLSMGKTVLNSAMRSLANSIGRQLMRGLMGALKK